MYKFLRI